MLSWRPDEWFFRLESSGLPKLLFSKSWMVRVTGTNVLSLAVRAAIGLIFFDIKCGMYLKKMGSPVALSKNGYKSSLLQQLKSLMLSCPRSVIAIICTANCGLESLSFLFQYSLLQCDSATVIYVWIAFIARLVPSPRNGPELNLLVK